MFLTNNIAMIKHEDHYLLQVLHDCLLLFIGIENNFLLYDVIWQKY